MHRTNAILFVLLLVMPVMVWAAAPIDPVRRLIVQQSAAADAVWLAEVRGASGSERTVIWERAEGEGLWRVAAEIPGGVQELTASDGRLAALLPDGQWQSVNLATGQPLPSGGRILCLAGGGADLFALGRMPSPSTLPASTQAAAMRESLPPGLHLFRLERGAWHHVAAVPPGVDGEPGRTLSLAVAERRPTIVTVGQSQAIEGISSREVAVWQWDKQRWDRRSQWTTSAAVSAIQAFDSLDCVAVWTAAGHGLGQIRILVGADVRELNISGQAPVCDVRQIGGLIRVFYVDGAKIMERRFNPKTLAEEGSPVELHLARQGTEPPYLKWVQGGILALLVMAMGAAMLRRGKQSIKIDFKKVRLAPVGRRFLAGSIDAIPLVVGAMWVASHYSQFPEFQELNHMPEMIVQFWLVMGIYLTIVTVTEVFFGRSVGKMLTGLRVLRLDGAVPGAVAMFVRNFLRVVDLWMVITLVLILMLPLRQRIGDIAAGTVVVADIAPEEDDLGAGDSP